MFDHIILNICTEFIAWLHNIGVSAYLPEVYFKYLYYLPIFFIAWLISILFTPIIGQIAKYFNILDLPSELRENSKMINEFDDPNRHIHTKPVPFLGGLSILIPLIIILILFVPLNSSLIAIIIGTLIIMLSGFLDDKYNFPAIWQLIAQILASLMVVISVNDLTFIDNPFNGIVNLNLYNCTSTLWNFPISVVFPGDLILIPWILLCINALKWVGGSDGLIETNAFVSFILIFILGIRTGIDNVALFSILISGLISGYLYYNYPPAKIFTGSTGKTSFGFLIASLSLLNGSKLSITLFILALPIADAIITGSARYFKYRVKNPLEIMKINDKSHLHHQLINLGFNAKQILWTEFSLASIVGSVGIFIVGANKFLAILLTFAVLMLFITIVRVANEKKEKEKSKNIEKESPESKYSY